jgi:hypothetical protein
LTAEQTVTDLRMRRRDLQFALIRALGGGFDSHSAGIALPAATANAAATASSG